jgi:hypothetical protein
MNDENKPKRNLFFRGVVAVLSLTGVSVGGVFLTDYFQSMNDDALDVSSQPLPPATPSFLYCTQIRFLVQTSTEEDLTKRKNFIISALRAYTKKIYMDFEKSNEELWESQLNIVLHNDVAIEDVRTQLPSIKIENEQISKYQCYYDSPAALS